MKKIFGGQLQLETYKCSYLYPSTLTVVHRSHKMATRVETLSVYSNTLELSTVPATPTTPTAGSEAGILDSVAGTSEPDDSVHVQQLPPVDGGKQAWLFCFASFVVEALVWGFGFW